MIVIMLKSVSESKSEVSSEESTLVPLVAIGMIVDVFPDSVPPNALTFFYFIAEAKDFHTVIIEGIWFC